MSYRVDADKGFALLNCVRPRLIYVNGLFGSGKTYFAELFKNEGFSVISLEKIYKRLNGSLADASPEEIRAAIVKEVHSHLDRFYGVVPIVVEGFMKSTDVIQEIFSGREYEIFTYVFMYPNNARRYKERILQELEERDWSFDEVPPYSVPPDLLSADELQELKENGKGANTAVRKLSDINRKMYADHLAEFDDHILTILQ